MAGSEAMPSNLKAVVFGATGAVGREIVRQLVASPKWSAVTTVGRRPLDPPPPGAGKLTQLTVDMDALEREAAAALTGAHAVFVALGTTRAVAGSAEAFLRVDRDYPLAAVRAAAAAGVAHCGLVSAVGANASLPANGWRIAHGLLYSKAKGEVEAAVRAARFSAGATIARPGLIERGDLTRGPEKWMAMVMSSVPAARVAAALVGEAEKAVAGGGVRVLSMKELQAYGGA